jgi:cell division protein FtsB
LRWLALVFVLLIAALQYPMWLGKGGWLQVRETSRSVAKQHDANVRLKARNEALDAEVRDLKTGFDAIEERARSELGMVRQDEVFFQLQPDAGRAGTMPAPGASAVAAPPRKNSATPAPATR